MYNRRSSGDSYQTPNYGFGVATSSAPPSNDYRSVLLQNHQKAMMGQHVNSGNQSHHHNSSSSHYQNLMHNSSSSQSQMVPNPLMANASQYHSMNGGHTIQSFVDGGQTPLASYNGGSSGYSSQNNGAICYGITASNPSPAWQLNNNGLIQSNNPDNVNGMAQSQYYENSNYVSGQHHSTSNVQNNSLQMKIMQMASSQHYNDISGISDTSNQYSQSPHNNNLQMQSVAAKTPSAPSQYNISNGNTSLNKTVAKEPISSSHYNLSNSNNIMSSKQPTSNHQNTLQMQTVSKAPAGIISTFSGYNNGQSTSTSLSAAATMPQSLQKIAKAPVGIISFSGLTNGQFPSASSSAAAKSPAGTQYNTEQSTSTASSAAATSNATATNKTTSVIPVRPNQAVTKQPAAKSTSNSQQRIVPNQTNNPATKPTKTFTPKAVVSKRIEIPSEFPPLHSYRATAAYSLLRTLSKELRLSPFTMQSFLSALMLPIPSKLLGEIHVRVMRVLFANIGMGSYAKHGRGVGPIYLKRASRNKLLKSGNENGAVDEMADEFVRAKSYDNLYYLDNLTWPLFYEDYAVATEEKFLNDTNDNEEFIDGRSTAMIPDEKVLTHHRIYAKKSSSIPPYPGEGWIDRCPIGPLGRRNPTTGRFVCCPFHIHAALMKYSRGPHAPAATTTTAPLPKKRKRSKTPKKKYTSDGSSSDYSNNSNFDSDEDFVTKPEKKAKGTGKRGRPRKYPKVEATPTPSPLIQKTSSPNSIKGSRVIDIETAPVMPGYKMAHPAPVQKVPPPKQTIQPVVKPLAVAQPNYAMPRPVVQPAAQKQQILVPPIPPQPVDLNAMVVSRDSNDTITRYFLEGDLFRAETEEYSGETNSPHKSTTEEETKGPPDLFGCNLSNQEQELIHMAPIKQLRKGIPYHHLSLEMKLTMIEFLLDELLMVDEIAREVTLRGQLTDSYNALYGELPHPTEFESLVNEDECAICGLEGDLLCCDGCPGSFHKQCMGMFPSAKLPEGKWLCTECRVLDGSRMGPLRGESRPLIGWFCLEELEPTPAPIHNIHEISSSVSSLEQTKQFLLNSEEQTISSPNVPGSFPQEHNAAHQHQSLLKSISSTVEFLVTTGKVFARHRKSHQRFDPFNPLATDTDTSKSSGKEMMPNNNPTEPLSNAQVMELLKILGPEMCLKLPWSRLIFSPQKLFGISQNPSDPLNTLISRQNESRQVLASHPETSNPLDYGNKYRAAPPIPQVKHQLGQIVLPAIVPEVFRVPATVVSQFGLNLANSLGLNSVMNNHRCSLAFQDVTQALRDQLIKIGKQIYDAQLLNGWETLYYKWVADVRHARVRRLSALLVKLADACSPRAFQNEWHQVKDNENPAETSRLSQTNNNYKNIDDDWTASGESKLRKWQRRTRGK
jgi:hypothetical protein